MTRELFDVLFGESSDLVLVTRLADGVILVINERVANSLGFAPGDVVGKQSTVLHTWADPDIRAAMLREVEGTGLAVPRVARFRASTGEELWLDVSMKRVEFAGEPAALSIARDVTRRVRAEAALRESDARHRAVIESMAEGITVQDLTGAILSCNEAAERILGLSADQMAGRTSLDPRWRSIHEDGSAWPGDLHPAMVTLATGEPVEGAVMGVHKPSSVLTWISINSWPIHDPETGETSGVVCSFTDITPLRQSEQARLELTAEMFKAEHAERARIAGALHDDTVQVMVATLMSLDRARNALQAGEYETLERAVDAARSTLGAALDRTRRLMFELRPPLLETGGIQEAVRDLAEHTAAENDLRLELELDVDRHDPDTEAVIYATIREAIANVRRHARATTLRVSVRDEAGWVSGEVGDDGVGFDTRRLHTSRPRLHLGVDSMTERVRLAGGTLDLQSEPGHGTRVMFRVPAG